MLDVQAGDTVQLRDGRNVTVCDVAYGFIEPDGKPDTLITFYEGFRCSGFSRSLPDYNLQVTDRSEVAFNYSAINRDAQAS